MVQSLFVGAATTYPPTKNLRSAPGLPLNRLLTDDFFLQHRFLSLLVGAIKRFLSLLVGAIKR
jgi:hypothetical protein